MKIQHILSLTILGCITFYIYGLTLEPVGVRFDAEKAFSVDVAQAQEPSPTPTTAYKDKYQEYIYKVFGSEDGEIMYAIAQSESGLREDAFNTYNSNGSTDLGLFQVNSVHFHKEGCDPASLLEYKANTDCAYKIFKSQGFNAWSAFNSGAYKNKL